MPELVDLTLELRRRLGEDTAAIAGEVLFAALSKALQHGGAVQVDDRPERNALEQTVTSPALIVTLGPGRNITVLSTMSRPEAVGTGKQAALSAARATQLKMWRTEITVLLTDADPPVSDPAAVVDRMLAAVPEFEPAGMLGPFYNTAGLVDWLHLTRQAVHARIKAGKLLGCPTEDGRMVYPSWQFMPDGTSLPHLSNVLRVLRRGSNDPWMHALWLVTPRDRLDGYSAAVWLSAGRAASVAVREAEQDAARWAA